MDIPTRDWEYMGIKTPLMIALFATSATNSKKSKKKGKTNNLTRLQSIYNQLIT